jgi:hypothetical protein
LGADRRAPGDPVRQQVLGLVGDLLAYAPGGRSPGVTPPTIAPRAM